MKNNFNTFRTTHYHLGIGLIELLVSMLIGLLIMAGVVQMVSTTSQNAIVNTGISRIQENARYAFSRLSMDFTQTGNLGCFNSSFARRYEGEAPTAEDISAGRIRNFLSQESNNGNLYDFRDIITGNDNVQDLTLGSHTVKNNTDVFRIRYVDDAARIAIPDAVSIPAGVNSFNIGEDAESIDEFQIVVLSDCTNSDVFMVTNDPGADGDITRDDTVSPSNRPNPNQSNQTSIDYNYRAFNVASTNSRAYLYAGRTHQYFIGTSAAASGGENCDVDNPQNCSLFRSEAGVNRELVHGVHDMQIEYGWTDDQGNLRLDDALEVANQQLWSSIDRVSITLSLNSIENAKRSTDSAPGKNFNAVLDKEFSKVFTLFNQL